MGLPHKRDSREHQLRRRVPAIGQECPIQSELQFFNSLRRIETHTSNRPSRLSSRDWEPQPLRRTTRLRMSTGTTLPGSRLIQPWCRQPSGNPLLTPPQCSPTTRLCSAHMRNFDRASARLSYLANHIPLFSACGICKIWYRSSLSVVQSVSPPLNRN